MDNDRADMSGAFWPKGVPRYLTTPPIPLEEGLVQVPAGRWPSSPALLTPSETVTYAELQERVAEASQRLLTCLAGGQRIALALSQPAELAVLLLAAFKAQCQVLLPNMASPPSEVTRHIQAFRTSLMIADQHALGPVEALLRNRVPIMKAEEVWASPCASPAIEPAPPSTPALALAGRGEHLVLHPPRGLLSGALSWSAFFGLKEGETVLALQSPYTWEGLYSIMAPLSQGAACVLAPWQDAEQVTYMLEQHHPLSTTISLPRAISLLEQPDPRLVQALHSSLKYICLSVPGPFPADLRRKLQALLRVPVLTVFGSAEAGPALASHWEWYVDQAVGIPLSNVDLWPLQPSTGKPLLVPWDCLEFAELGVSSPMTMVRYVSSPETAGPREGRPLRTGLIATRDANGFFYLLESA